MAYHQNKESGMFEQEFTLESNREKSKVRCRVEHVFDFMERTMGGLVFRGSRAGEGGGQRRHDQPGYNMFRLAQIVRCHKEWIAVNN